MKKTHAAKFDDKNMSKSQEDPPKLKTYLIVNINTSIACQEPVSLLLIQFPLVPMVTNSQNNEDLGDLTQSVANRYCKNNRKSSPIGEVGYPHVFFPQYKQVLTLETL